MIFNPSIMYMTNDYQTVFSIQQLLNIIDVNRIFRKSIINEFFIPELTKLDFKKSNVKHPEISTDGLMQSNLLHIFFDVETGNDYPDGDEWFIAEFLFPYQMKLPDNLKGTDYFTTISVEEGKNFWHHRELVRYKYGKSKKLDESLDFIESKYKELHGLVEPLEKEIKQLISIHFLNLQISSHL